MATKRLSELQIIGANIKKLRKGQNVSRAQLAFEINTTEKQLSRIENGEINSGILNYINICRALNVSTADLFIGIKNLG